MAAVAYAVLLPTFLAVLGIWPHHAFSGEQLLVVGVLAVLAAGEYLASRALWQFRMVFDMGMALGVVALVIAGPLAAVGVLLVPDALHLARRRRAFWNVGLAANVTSYAAAALAGAGILTLSGSGPMAAWVIVVAAVMVTVNYLLARLLLVAVRDRQPLLPSARAEFISILPIHAVVIAITTVTALLVPDVGVAALGAFVCLGYLPQLVLERLLRAPSIAGLAVDAAAAVYRAAIVDQLGLPRRERRRIEQIAALVDRRPDRVGPIPNPLAIMPDALVVSICLQRAPVQPAYRATERAQVVVCAQRWAELTARCTPALSHREAITELQRSSVAHDAPETLAAAAAIVDREHALSVHVAGVPRLHRLPAPRVVRQRYLPDALTRLLA